MHHNAGMHVRRMRQLWKRFRKRNFWQLLALLFTHDKSSALLARPRVRALTSALTGVTG